MNIELRQEMPNDYANVKKIIQEAFKDILHSDQREHLLVERLRDSAAFIPALSIVACQGNEVVGHILLTKIKIKNQTQSFESLALAPVSVHPLHQKKGIGGQLILEAHKIARSLGYSSIVLLGHETYYPRFGYQLCNTHNIELPFEVPKENCMVIELIENGLKGVSGIVEYDPAFYE